MLGREFCYSSRCNCMSSCTGDLVRPGSTAFQEAVDAVKSGRLSVRQAAEHYSCARSTLSSHARDSVRHRGPGRPTTLSELEEKIIVRSCVALGTFGYPPNRDLIGRVVQQYFAEIGRPNAGQSSQKENHNTPLSKELGVAPQM